MSSKGSPQRVVLILSVVGAALLLLGGVAIWRYTPERQVGVALAQHADAGSYQAPDSIPVVLEDPDLRGARVALVVEPENAILTLPGDYDREVATWRRWLEEMNARIVPPEDADVLVMPLADCLNNEMRQLVERHLAGGGGLVTNGVLGSRDGFCSAAPDTVLLQLLGETRIAREDAGRSHIVLLGETMLSADIPAGARVDLQPKSHVLFRGEQREAYFADYERRPQPAADEPFFDGAAARAVVGDGRVVALGFGISEVMGGWSERVSKLLVRNAVNWAAGRPVVQLATWPGDYQAAGFVAQDVEADYANAAGAIPIIEAAGIPTTYFIVGSLAQTHPFITRDMAESGEIASHSFSHLPMDEFPPGGQRNELVMSKSSAEEFAPGTVRGFRPPQERFTLETLETWAELGGDYFFASDLGRSAVPVIVPFGPDSLVFLGRVNADDYDILSRHGMRDRGAMVRTLVRQMDEVIAYRGAYLFSYHSHMLAQDQLLPVLEAVIDALKARPELWLTNAGDLARWWRTRAAVELVVAEDGQSVELRNHGETTYSEGAMLVDLPSGERRRIEVPDLRGGEAVRVRIAPTPS